MMVFLASFMTLVAPDLPNRKMRSTWQSPLSVFPFSCLADGRDAFAGPRARERAARVEDGSGRAVLSLPMSARNLQGGRVRRRFAIGGGQVNRERAAFARGARDRHAAAMGLDNAAHDAEAETVAVNLLRLRLGATVERLEHVGQVGRRDAEATILDDDLNVAAATGARLARAHAHPRRRPAVL